LSKKKMTESLLGPSLITTAATLAEPEPEGPTDEELYDLADQYAGNPVASMREALVRWGNSDISQSNFDG
jgi:hypothetical protein